MADTKKKILIVDDDENITELIGLYLTKEGYDFRAVHDGEEAVQTAHEYYPDLILLDVMLPGMSGYEVCQRIREYSTVPVIMLSAKGETFDKVTGLQMGADDYIVKPFDSKELLARIAANLRRADMDSTKGDSQSGAPDQVSYPGLTVSLTSYTVIYHDTKLEMPPKELELLYFLASNPNQVFTREQLLNNIWGYDYVGDTRTVDVHVKRLREKFPFDDPWEIGTVWGVGYRFEVDQ